MKVRIKQAILEYIFAHPKTSCGGAVALLAAVLPHIGIHLTPAQQVELISVGVGIIGVCGKDAKKD